MIAKKRATPDSRTIRVSTHHFVLVESLADSTGESLGNTANALIRIGLEALSITDDGRERMQAEISLLRAQQEVHARRKNAAAAKASKSPTLPGM